MANKKRFGKDIDENSYKMGWIDSLAEMRKVARDIKSKDNKIDYRDLIEKIEILDMKN